MIYNALDTQILKGQRNSSSSDPYSTTVFKLCAEKTEPSEHVWPNLIVQFTPMGRSKRVGGFHQFLRQEFVIVGENNLLFIHNFCNKWLEDVIVVLDEGIVKGKREVRVD